MEHRPPKWEALPSGGSILRLYHTELNPDWPRIVILDLSAEEFKQFEDDPLVFDGQNKLYPEQSLVWASTCQKPPVGTPETGLPPVRPDSRWRVVVVHSRTSTMCSAGSPIE
jgi:hypothetical protein